MNQLDEVILKHEIERQAIRTVICLHREHDMSTEEISEATGLPDLRVDTIIRQADHLASPSTEELLGVAKFLRLKSKVKGSYFMSRETLLKQGPVKNRQILNAALETLREYGLVSDHVAWRNSNG